ncbi:MAG: hypothetical protein R3E39_22585 [Anaerolineae bacterium]
MTVLNKLASALERNDEVPNQLLAKEIAAGRDRAGVRELVDNLTNKDKAIAADCIKVLYEVGYVRPELIAPYVENFVALLTSRNNRMVWGGMTALGAIAPTNAAAVLPHLEAIIAANDNGSVITQDWGVRVLAALAAHDEKSEQRIFPYLLSFLERCPPKDLPRHAESVLVAVNNANRDALLKLLEGRAPSLKPAPAKRLAAIIKKLRKP